MFGNSITRGGDFQQQFTDEIIINIGISGDDLGGMARRAWMVKALNPRKIFLLGGVNGLKHLDDEEFAIRYNALIDSLQSAAPQAQLILQTILPVAKDFPFVTNKRIDSTNEVVKRIAKNRGLVLIDTHNLYVGDDGALPDSITIDGIHLHQEYYDRWFDTLSPYMVSVQI